MTRKPSPPSSPDRPEPLLPYERGQVPEPVESNSTTTWAEFERLQAQQDARFAQTRPPSVAEEAAFALTELDAGLPGASRPGQRASRPLSLYEVLLEARRLNRVCPKPLSWQQLYEQLARHVGRRPLQLPISGPAWMTTGAMPKRACLRSQIEWAAEAGALEEVMAFFQSLSEAQWHHTDD